MTNNSIPDNPLESLEGLSNRDLLVILIVVRFKLEEEGKLTLQETRETAQLLCFCYRAWGDEFDADLQEALDHIERRRELRKQQSGGRADPRAAGVPAHKLPRLTGPLWQVYE